MKIDGRAVLKAGRDGPVRGGNPWIFSQAIARLEPSAMRAGDLVEVDDSTGLAIGLAHYNPATTIALRMLAFDTAIEPGDLIHRRLARALELRNRVVTGETNCYRLLNGDGDGLSGVIIDRYGDAVVVQLLTAGADRMRGELVAALGDQITPRTILERSQGAVRRQEGLDDRTGVLAGEPIAVAQVVEDGIRLAVDLEHGQKTGGFLDQRGNRATIREIARGARMLDAYCYTGGFALAAIAGGARQVVGVDSSERAIAAARRNLALNGYPADRAELVHGDAVRYLAAAATERPAGERFDLIVLDPPPLARSLKDAVNAGRLYIDLNALAMRALAPGGSLMTFSCSSHFGGEDFMRAVRIAQIKAGRKLRTIGRLGPGPDHPVLLGHAEGEYLTGVLLADLG
ncbi:MAG: class I SAM-dependent rRNA methyltransferase [Candidatus Binataceae bacterium]|nr:class I SAM-dependent rRNA methyltransferase [Candidatus Binataceae bacterium]